MDFAEKPPRGLHVHLGIKGVAGVARKRGDLDLFRQVERADRPQHGAPDAHPRARGRSGRVAQGADGRVVAVLGRARGVDDSGFELAEGYEEVDTA